jgi:hypothetical protein
MYDDKSAR